MSAIPSQDNNPGKRILAVDFGLKRIGLAVSDESRIVITPLPQLENKPGFITHQFKPVVQHYNPAVIVVGFPYHQRSDGQQSKDPFIDKLETFIEKIKSEFLEITVTTHDESFSSLEAAGIIALNMGVANSKKKKKSKKQKLDSTAAAILLKSFLASLNT